jgi:hypothetical protein
MIQDASPRGGKMSRTNANIDWRPTHHKSDVNSPSLACAMPRNTIRRSLSCPIITLMFEVPRP